MKTPANKMRTNVLFLENGIERKPWTEDKLKELILIYKTMPELWDRTHKKYQNKQHRLMLFEKLAAYFNTSIDDIRVELRYHKFRVQYALKRMQQNLTPRKHETIYTDIKWVKDSCFMITNNELLLNTIGNIPDNNAVEQSKPKTPDLSKTSHLCYDTLPNKGIRFEQSKSARRHSYDSSKDVACVQSKTSRLTNDCLVNDSETCDLSITSQLCYDSLPKKGIKCDQTKPLRRHSCDSQPRNVVAADPSKLSRLTNDPLPHKRVCDLSQTPRLTRESISNKVVSCDQSKTSPLSYDSLPNQVKRCNQLKGSRRNSYDSLANKSVKCDQSSGLTKNITRRQSVDIAIHQQFTTSEQQDPYKPQTNKNNLANNKRKNKSEVRKWTYDETLQLLQLYEKKMPEFWNRNLENFTWSKKERDKKYEEISHYFYTSARQVGMRITYLKTCFLKEKRELKMKSLKYNKPINEIECKWKYWKPMSFYLVNYIDSKDWSTCAYTQVMKRKQQTQQRRPSTSLYKDLDTVVIIDSSDESNSSRTITVPDSSDNDLEDSATIPLKKQSFTNLGKNLLPDGKIVTSEIIEYEDSDSESEQIDRNKYLTPERTVMKSDLISFEDTDIETNLLNAQCFANQFQNEESIAKSAFEFKESDSKNRSQNLQFSTNRLHSETISKPRFVFEESDSEPKIRGEQYMMPVISSIKTIESGDESDSSRTLSVPNLSDYEFEDSMSELRNRQCFTAWQQNLLPEGKISETEIQFEDNNHELEEEGAVPEMTDQTIKKLERNFGNLNSKFKPKIDRVLQI